jgi:hypothetical protein
MMSFQNFRHKWRTVADRHLCGVVLAFRFQNSVYSRNSFDTYLIHSGKGSHIQILHSRVPMRAKELEHKSRTRQN